MEADTRSTDYHNNLVLYYIWTIYLIENREYWRAIIYGVYRSWTCDDVCNYEFILSCRFLFLYGKIPKNYRRNPGFSYAILGFDYWIYIWWSRTRYVNWSYCTLGSIIFCTSFFCSYWIHNSFCISDISSFFSCWTSQLTHCREFWFNFYCA